MEEISKLKTDMLYVTEILVGEVTFLENKIKFDDNKCGADNGIYKIHPESFLNVCKTLEDLSASIKNIFNNGEGEPE
jgi:hypothetical protein